MVMFTRVRRGLPTAYWHVLSHNGWEKKTWLVKAGASFKACFSVALVASTTFSYTTERSVVARRTWIQKIVGRV